MVKVPSAPTTGMQRVIEDCFRVELLGLTQKLSVVVAASFIFTAALWKFGGAGSEDAIA